MLTLKALLSMVCWSLGGRAARVKMMSRLSASRPAAAHAFCEAVAAHNSGTC